MNLHVLPSPRAAARFAAEEIARLLRRRGPARLVLASGKTMVPVYRELVRLHRSGKAPFRRAVTFNLDELRLPASDPASFHSFMERRLFSKVDLPEERIHFLAGDAADPAAEASRFERELSAAGGADLALAGIGVNGHVAYVEPGPALVPRTSLVRLSASTIAGLRAQGLRRVPGSALTMGIETILESRRILLLATGRKKAAVIRAALTGKVTPRCPASYLSLHPALTVVLDSAAASSLSR